MECTNDYKLGVCYCLSGYFLGMKDGETVMCRRSNYYNSPAEVLVAAPSDIPVDIKCQKCCLLNDEEE